MVFKKEPDTFSKRTQAPLSPELKRIIWSHFQRLIDSYKCWPKMASDRGEQLYSLRRSGLEDLRWALLFLRVVFCGTVVKNSSWVWGGLLFNTLLLVNKFLSFSLGVSKLQPLSHIHPAVCCPEIRLLPLVLVHGCILTTMAEGSGCNRDQLAHRA